jgi:tetratricopeptide (TPR) repeat protein
MRTLVRGLVASALATGFFLAAAVTLGADDRPRSSPPVNPAALGRVPADLGEAVAGLQEHLRAQPRDVHGWATLGIGYVEQGRLSADPTYYPKAQAAFGRARALRADDDLALAGLGALAAARHDFAAALRWADRSLAVNPYGAKAHAVRVDALVELGRYPEAVTAARAADAAQPGLPTFARLSYLEELHGDLAGARSLMHRAAAAAQSPDDLAFAHTHLGDLARLSGDLVSAEREYAAALAAQPSYLPATVGRARLALSRGETGDALSLLEEVARRMPLPEHIVLLGETYEALGRDSEAEAQYAVVRTAIALAGHNGVGTDLETAVFEADHGDAPAALAAARREWARRHSVHAADALAWALHANGHDRAALSYARAATRLGTRDAGLLYHRGMIERSLGLRRDAGAHLTEALRVDPGFSPLRAARARAALARLGGAS